MSIPYKVSLCLTHANPTATIPGGLCSGIQRIKREKKEGWERLILGGWPPLLSLFPLLRIKKTNITKCNKWYHQFPKLCFSSIFRLSASRCVAPHGQKECTHAPFGPLADKDGKRVRRGTLLQTTHADDFFLRRLLRYSGCKAEKNESETALLLKVRFCRLSC